MQFGNLKLHFRHLLSSKNVPKSYNAQLVVHPNFELNKYGYPSPHFVQANPSG